MTPVHKLRVFSSRCVFYVMSPQIVMVTTDTEATEGAGWATQAEMAATASTTDAPAPEGKSNMSSSLLYALSSVLCF